MKIVTPYIITSDKITSSNLDFVTLAEHQAALSAGGGSISIAPGYMIQLMKASDNDAGIYWWDDNKSVTGLPGNAGDRKSVV
jgi:hypothetical protein